MSDQSNIYERGYADATGLFNATAEIEVLDSMMFETFAASSGGGGITSRLKIYVGGVWVAKPLKIYVGGVWFEKPLKFYNGATWE